MSELDRAYEVLQVMGIEIDIRVHNAFVIIFTIGSDIELSAVKRTGDLGKDTAKAIMAAIAEAKGG